MNRIERANFSLANRAAGAMQRVAMSHAPAELAVFDTLMSAVDTDTEVAAGLAEAYGAMSPDERSRLIDTVVADAKRAGRSPAGPLLSLLSVEEDGARQERLVDALLDQPGGLAATASRKSATEAWVYGEEGSGGTAVVRARFGDYVEVIHVHTIDERLGYSSEALALKRDLPAVRRRLGVPDHARRVSGPEGIDRLAQAIWSARRRGEALPEGLDRHADLFSP